MARKKSAKSEPSKRAGQSEGPQTEGRQWDLPASFTADGTRMATLREVADPAIPTKTLVELSDDERTDLFAKRLEMQPDDFQIAVLGVGIVDKTRAIAEVRARSQVGRNLAEIEHRIINQVTYTKT